MASRTLAGLSAVLSAARSVPDALLALSEEAAEADRGASVAMYGYDLQSSVLNSRTIVNDGEARTTAIEVSLDHLPRPVRRALQEGNQFTELGPQSDDYAKLLDFPIGAGGGAMLLRGLSIDGELTAIIALYEPKRMFGPKVSEKLAPALDLFVLAFERLAEREARLEATIRLEQLTRQLHDEHSRAVSDLEARLQQAQAALPGGTGADSRVAELQKAAEQARIDARVMLQRLTAVEEQVASAVGRLERAHLQLHEQSESIRQQRNLIYRIERMLRDAGGSASEKLIEDLLAVVSSSASPTEIQ